MSHSSAACSEIETLTESPAWTRNGTGREAPGSISTHAWYCVRPLPLTVCWVPAWIRSRVLTPPMPTHAASIPKFVSLVKSGMVQVPDTAVNEPPVAAYPDQLCEVFWPSGTAGNGEVCGGVAAFGVPG